MTISLLAGECRLWAKLTAAAKSASRADVAVAYFAKGGAKRLPLKRGSRLVVDASEARVKAGATCPQELLKLVQQGVQVFSRDNLHAKVFVFPKCAYIGSANNSASSATVLAEAVVKTTDAEVVRHARLFVGELCQSTPLGPKELLRLQKAYREPKNIGAVVAKRGKRASEKYRVFFDESTEEALPENSQQILQQALKAAKKTRVHPKTHELVEMWIEGSCKYRLGDILIMTTENEAPSMVDPPGRVVCVQPWRNGRRSYTFWIIERPRNRRVRLDRMTKALGRGWNRKLSKHGRLPYAVGRELEAWWSDR